MTDALVQFEQALIKRNDELQRQAEKTFIDATAIISDTVTFLFVFVFN